MHHLVWTVDERTEKASILITTTECCWGLCKHTGTHSSYQLGNWLTWSGLNGCWIILQLCVCVCVCVGEIVGKKLTERERDGESVIRKGEKRERERYGESDVISVSVSQRAVMMLSHIPCRDCHITHTHARAHTHTHSSKVLYKSLGCWSDGSVSYLVTGSEQPLLCIICLCTSKPLYCHLYLTADCLTLKHTEKTVSCFCWNYSFSTWIQTFLSSTALFLKRSNLTFT